MNHTPLSSVSRRFLISHWICQGLALLAVLHGSAFASSTFLVDENFSSIPIVTSGPRQLPSGWTITSAGGPLGATNIGAVDYADPLFGPKLKPLQEALLVEDRDPNSYPVIRAPFSFPANTNPIKGWMRIRFIPIEDLPNPSPTYTTPRLYYRLRSQNDVSLVKFQVNGGRLYYYDSSSGVEIGYQFDQLVVNNSVNELLVWFDITAGTLRGELNGVTLTRRDGLPVSSLHTGLLQGSDVINDVELRPGDAASYQEGFLLTMVQVGQGDGPANRQFASRGYIDIVVAARNIGQSSSDNMPASVGLNFSRLLDMAGYYGQRVKFSSLTIKLAAGGGNLPCRWYDDEAPKDFPSTTKSLSYNDNLSNQTPPLLEALAGNNLGATYPVFGYSGLGTLTWVHTQTGSADSTYRIDFDTESANATSGDPGAVARGWVGDGAPRFDTVAGTTSPSAHTRVAVTDWDGDGNKDIIFGDASGLMLVMRNLAVVTVADPHPTPVFRALEYVRDEFGDPVSIGIFAAPALVDWDGDGTEDMLVGTSWNRITYFRNIGTNQRRKFRYEGLVKINGSPLQIPWRPSSGPPTDVNSRDYYPIIEVTDWNGDGKKDLLLGGYVTGRIFYFENTNLAGQYSPSNPTAGIPILIAPFATMPNNATPSPYGAISLKDNAGIERTLNNVGDWCAAPTTVRLNGSHLTPDVLITGLLPRLGQSGLPDAPFVRLFFNAVAGTNQLPDFREIPTSQYDPATSPYFSGTVFPAPRLSSPRLADMNNDGLPDLVVSSGTNIYIFMNVGTSFIPKWALNNNPILSFYYGSARVNGVSPVQFLDLNGDALTDIFESGYYSMRIASANPYLFQARTSIFAAPVASHIPAYTPQDTAHQYPLIANVMSKLFDLDLDGKYDYLYGDPNGHIWFHKNNGTSSQLPYTLENVGVECQTEDGNPIYVDLSNGSVFDLQDAGARPVFTVADFNGDGKPDIVRGDTFSNVRYFEGTGQTTAGGNPKFKAPTSIGTQYVPPARGQRLAQIDSTDWNGDGKLDLVVSAAAANTVTVYLNDGLAHFTKQLLPADQASRLSKTLNPATIMVDLDGDGGPEDIFMTSTQGSVWFERSFVDSGYPTISSVGNLTPY